MSLRKVLKKSNGRAAALQDVADRREDHGGVYGGKQAAATQHAAWNRRLKMAETELVGTTTCALLDTCAFPKIMSEAFCISVIL